LVRREAPTRPAHGKARGVSQTADEGVRNRNRGRERRGGGRERGRGREGGRAIEREQTRLSIGVSEREGEWMVYTASTH
jgi:hypothetical protein